MTTSDSNLKASQKVFRQRLLKWWQTNKRSFRWRETNDLYEVLIAEILLRRTNAPAAHKIYLEFLEKFPDATSFANADSDSIEVIANKLGLFWRGRNLSSLAASIRDRGSIPNDFDGLSQLPGVGPYVVRAVMVNAFGASHVAVDSNVVRVICRYLGETPRDSLRRNKTFQKLADSFRGKASARIFNYALLDFSAAICTPTRPKCSICPLASHCKSANLV